MSRTDEFDWNEFTKIGIEFVSGKNQAKQRTGISRFYYGAFCQSRNFLNKKGTYLGEKSKKIMTSKSVDVHSETSRIFKRHKKYKNGNKGKIISKNLNKLRKMRNQADYDNVIHKSLSKMLNDSKILSDEILNLLTELN